MVGPNDMVHAIFSRIPINQRIWLELSDDGASLQID